MVMKIGMAGPSCLPGFLWISKKNWRDGNAKKRWKISCWYLEEIGTTRSDITLLVHVDWNLNLN